jgi:hypothetical protein
MDLGLYTYRVCTWRNQGSQYFLFHQLTLGREIPPSVQSPFLSLFSTNSFFSTHKNAQVPDTLKIKISISLLAFTLVLLPLSIHIFPHHSAGLLPTPLPLNWFWHCHWTPGHTSQVFNFSTSLKYITSGAESLVQIVECLPSKHKALSSNPITLNKF